MSGSKAGAQRNHLSWELMVKVTDYVRSNYTSSRLYDATFAELATKALQFPVTEANIFAARKALGIVSNYRVRSAELKGEREAKRAVAKPEGLNLVLDELHALNQGIVMLSSKLDKVLAKLG